MLAFLHVPLRVADLELHQRNVSVRGDDSVPCFLEVLRDVVFALFIRVVRVHGRQLVPARAHHVHVELLEVRHDEVHRVDGVA